MENNVPSISKYFLLSELSKKELHGYEMISRIAHLTGKKPSPSQIYPVLKRLQKDGFVKINELTNGKKKVKFYSLTSSGKKLFVSMNKKFDILIQSALKEKIRTCAHCNCEMIRGGVKKGGKDFCCNSCAKASHDQ